MRLRIIQPLPILKDNMDNYEELKYFSSNQLMADVRRLDYKQQYKVCEAFYNLMVEEGFGDDSERCLLFVNDFDNAIYEIDIYDPSMFFHIVRVLEPIIKKSV